MEKDWTPVYSTDKEYIAEMIKDILLDNEIQSVVINKRDSSYISIGDIEIYVSKDDALKARFLIEKMNS